MLNQSAVAVAVDGGGSWGGAATTVAMIQTRIGRGRTGPTMVYLLEGGTAGHTTEGTCDMTCDTKELSGMYLGICDTYYWRRYGTSGNSTVLGRK